jgi:Skp family chaperone for outer membrane proteins
VIAVVDRQRVVSECNACKVAATQIQALITQAQQRQQTLASPLQSQDQALQAEAGRIRALPEGAAKTAAIAALQPRIQAFQQQQGAAQQEIQGIQQNIQSVNNNVLRQITDKLNPIVGQVMQQRGATIALDQEATLASAKTVDVTDQVLTALNAQLTTVSVTPLPAAAAAPGTPAPTRRAPTGR